MAKRKRLNPAVLESPFETKAVEEASSYRRASAPIAEVSGDSATRAALEEVTQELQSARSEGRFVMRLPLSALEETHLVRDRIVLDEDELVTLMASLKDRGQQMPVEVVELAGGRYGLISGWRRLTALRRLHAETGEERFAEIQALVRSPKGASEAYRAMVEENEIRAGLSFYERARIVVQAAGQGIYPNKGAAVAELFAAAPAPKRSKILSFTMLVEALDNVLRFPTAIPEHLGLGLAGRLQDEATFADQLASDLTEAAPADAAAERNVLERALKGRESTRSSRSHVETIAPGIALKVSAGRVTLSGQGVDKGLTEDLRRWLSSRS